MYKIIVLMGKAGSGKDTLMQAILQASPDLHSIVSCTTRPPREGEIEGKNYYFLTHEEFAERLANGRMIEATIFNDWCYGTCLDHMREDKINIGVYSPEGVDILCSIPGIEVYPIFIDASHKTRLLRQLNRENDPDVYEIVRRFHADEEDFSDENLQDIEIKLHISNNGDLSIQDLAKDTVTKIMHAFNKAQCN